MLIYLLKSSLCLGIFQLFYILLLEKENMHRFKRFYLLATTLASFLIPLVLFTEYVVVPASSQNTIRTIQEFSSESGVIPETSTNYLPILVWGVYAVGALIFGFNFFKNLFAMLQRIRKNPKYKAKNRIWVLLSNPTIPHTFFNYIFLNRKKFEKKEIPDAVLLHEEAHARQKHSLDVVFVELVQVFFWFNPLIIALKRAIKLNHEFLADQAVVRTGMPTKTYQSLILAYSSHAFSPKLANSLYYSSTRLTIFGKTFTLGPSVFGQVKKRISVMKTQTSKKGILIRSILLLPLTAALLFGFSERTRIPMPQSTIIVGRELQEKEPTQQGASRQQLETYNALARKYNKMDRNHIYIKKQEVDTLKEIYGLMTKQQKEEAEPFPEFPEPPPAPAPPQPPHTADYASNVIEKTIEIQDPYDVSIKGPSIPVPPTPSSPKSPLDHVIEMAKQGAIFYYEDKVITSDKAIDIMKKNSKINIETHASKSEKPIVKISTDD